MGTFGTPEVSVGSAVFDEQPASTNTELAASAASLSICFVAMLYPFFFLC
jgi:hypothetical protein